MPKTHRTFVASCVWLSVALAADAVFAQSPAVPAADEPAAAAPARPAALRERGEKPRVADDEKRALTLAGIVRDPSGQPSAKATVWLVVRRGEVFDQPVKIQSDE